MRFLSELGNRSQPLVLVTIFTQCFFLPLSSSNICNFVFFILPLSSAMVVMLSTTMLVTMRSIVIGRQGSLLLLCEDQCKNWLNADDSSE